MSLVSLVSSVDSCVEEVSSTLDRSVEELDVEEVEEVEGALDLRLDPWLEAVDFELFGASVAVEPFLVSSDSVVGVVESWGPVST